MKSYIKTLIAIILFSGFANLFSQNHFFTVWNGKTPFQAMNIYLETAKLGTSDLSNGDEIGIFDGTLCVGAVILTGPVPEYLEIKVSSDDPVTTTVIDGFTNGNAITYKLWYASKAVEILNPTVTYNAASPNTVFTNMGTAFVNLVFPKPIENYSVTLNKSGTGSGQVKITVSGNPAQTVSLPYTLNNIPSGTTATLEAIQSSGSVFAGWLGHNESQIVDNNNPVQTIINKNRIITVRFNLQTLPAPVATAATEIANVSFNANWNEVSGATKYFLDVSTSNDFSTFVTDYNNKDVGNVNTFSVTGLNANTDYFYRIRASDGTNTSISSNIIQVKTSAIDSKGKLLYLKIGAPSGWTTSGSSGSQYLEIQEWEIAGFTVTKQQLDITTITSELLNNYEILRLNICLGLDKTFTDAEALALYNWVQAGGKLFADVTCNANVNIVKLFGVNNIVNGSNHGYWTYGGSPLITTLLTGPAGPWEPMERLVFECMNIPVLTSESPLIIAATYNSHPAVTYGDFGTGKVVINFTSGWSHDATWPGNEYRASIFQGSNIIYLRNCISFFKTTSAPVAVPATEITLSSFKANWKSVATATKYYLDVSTVSNFSSFLTGFNNKDVGNVTSFSVASLNVNTKYYYRLRASNGTLISPNSNSILVKTSLFTEVASTPFIRVDQGNMVWGDYDNDGDLDLFIMGNGQNEQYSTKIYRNDNEVFTDINASLIQIADRNGIALGDYDNDGDLDLVLIGKLSNGTLEGKLYKNNNGIYSETNILLPKLNSSAVKWFDYDNDGDLDLIVTGSNDPSTPNTNRYTKLLRNDGNDLFTEVSTSIPGMNQGIIDVADYDNDGDMDLLLSGWVSYPGSCVTKIIRNDNGVFTDINASLEGLHVSAGGWIDYDKDGDLDILISGSNQALQPKTKLYRNDNGVFTEVPTSLPNLTWSEVSFGDMDNDGDMDLILSGATAVSGISSTKIYINNNGTFEELESLEPQVSQGFASFADYDKDGDLDVVFNGLFGNLKATKLYKNNSVIKNSSPTVPTNLSSIYQNGVVTLSWDKSTDTQTTQNNLTYNIRIGKSSGKEEIKSSSSNLSDGFRKIVDLGNVGSKNNYQIKNLAPGTYYWSVQGIDNGFMGSGFAQEKSFVVEDNATSFFKDDFSGDLSKWQNYQDGGLWEIRNGKLYGNYNIGMGSTSNSQSVLIIKDQYQPTGDWKATVKFEAATDPNYPSYKPTGVVFSLFESLNKKIYIGVGGDANNTSLTKIYGSYGLWNGTSWFSQVGQDYNFNWNTNVVNSATLEKVGTVYKFYINDIFIFSYNDTYLNGTGKLGLHTYGPKLLDDFVINLTSTSNLVANYPFNGNANDESGNAINGTVNGAVLTTDRFGVQNKAFSFNGTSNYIEIPNNTLLNPQTALTVSTWVFFEDFNNVEPYYGNCILSKGNSNSIGSYNILYTSNNAKVVFTNRFPNEGGIMPSNVSPLNPFIKNRWYHLVSTYDGTKMKLYINSILFGEKTVTGNMGVNTEKIYLGYHPHQDYPYWLKGKIDDVKIYNTALTQQEISSLFTENGWTVNPEIVITSPTGGEKWDASSAKTITWNSTNVTGNVNIKLSVDGGTNYSILLAGNTANDGTEQIQVPNNISSNCKIKVESVNDISVFGVSAANFTIQLTNKLVAYYPFNGNANDESGNGNNGTANGVILVQDRNGNNNSAYKFDGTTSNYILVQNSQSLQLQDKFTISLWEKADESILNLNWAGHLLSKGATFGQLYCDYGLLLGLPNGNIFAELNSSSTNDQTNSASINSAKLVNSGWHHVLLTFNSGLVTIYIDGIQALQKNVSITSLRLSNQPLYIGARYFDSDPKSMYPFKGTLDDIRIYNYAIEKSKIDSLYYENGYNSIVYGGKTYHTVQIGNQIWMKENLDIGTMIQGNQNAGNNGTIEKYCYNNSADNCTKYGALYQWNELMAYSTTPGTKGICPDNWHIPTLTELQTLYSNVNSDGKALLQVGEGPGTNTSGFSALWNGYRSWDNNFYGVGQNTSLWSSNESGDQSKAQLFGIGENSVFWNSSKLDGFTVRCLKDDATLASIKVTAPVGGESWDAGSTKTVTWNSTNVTGNVNIKLSIDGGNSYLILLAGNTANDGTEQIQVPNNISSTCKIKVELANDISVFGVSAANFTIQLTNKLVAYYPFNGNANDESGNANNGANNGAQLTSDRFGVNNKAFSLPNSTSYIQVIDNPMLDFSSSRKLTIAVWVKLNSLTAGYIIDKFGPGGPEDDDFSMMTSEGKIRVDIDSPTNFEGLTSKSILEIGKWYFIVYQWDGIAAKQIIYIDGVKDTEISTIVTNINNTNTPLRFGKPNHSSPGIVGALDDIRVYNYSLNSSQVDSLYKLEDWLNYKTPLHKFYISVSGNDEIGNGSIMNPFKSVTKALLAVKDRDTLIIKAGEYIENITIEARQNLVIIGENKNTTKLNGTINLRQKDAVKTENTIIKNLTFKGIDIAMFLVCPNTLIEDCILIGQSFLGVGPNGAKFIKNTFLGKDVWASIYMHDSWWNVFEQNEFIECQQGIYHSGGGNTIIKNNVFRNCISAIAYGNHVNGTHNNYIVNNTMINCSLGYSTNDYSDGDDFINGNLMLNTVKAFNKVSPGGIVIRSNNIFGNKDSSNIKRVTGTFISNNYEQNKRIVGNGFVANPNQSSICLATPTFTSIDMDNDGDSDIADTVYTIGAYGNYNPLFGAVNLSFANNKLNWLFKNGDSDVQRTQKGFYLEFSPQKNNWENTPISTGLISSVNSLYQINSLEPGKYFYRLRVIDQNNISSNWTLGLDSLEISKSSISVLSPNGGESWESATTQTVTWNSSNVTGNVAIKLSTNGGTTFETVLVSNTANDGTEQITVPTVTSTNSTCKIKVESVSDASVYGVSASNFTITPLNGWELKLTIKDQSNIGGDVTLGVKATATDGIDLIFGEAALPPSPPSGIFDARFELPGGTEYSAKDYRKDGQDKITWNIKFQPGSGGYPITFIWDNTKLPEGSVTLKDIVTGTIVNVNMKSVNTYTLTNSGIKILSIEFSKNICSIVELLSGWNLISVPVKALDMNTTTLFPEYTSSTYSYDNGYKIESLLVNGKGYWLRYPSAKTLSICGEKVNKTRITVKTGWNLIGVYDTEIATGDITVSSGTINSQFYGYLNGYVVPSKLLPGKGYWIRVSADGELILVPGTSPSTEVLAKVNSSEISNDGIYIHVKDAIGRREKLELGRFANLLKYDLPPMPPKGIFEVRWGSDRKVENLDGTVNEILLNSAEYPLTITVEGSDLLFKDKFGGKFLNTIVKKGESISISNKSITELEVSTIELPTTFELMQNYPNPFNPSTTIGYSIPETGRVTLKVFDVLGREVATLVDEVQQAGVYNTTLNTQQLAFTSGIYFYQIQSGSFMAVKKLILIK